MSNDVQVGVKLRPLTKKEISENSSIRWIVKGDSIVSLDQKTNQGGDEFYFDHVFDLDTANSKVFDSMVKPVIDAAINGSKGTVFCYGQCNSGKTYTIAGTSEDLGLIPLSIKHILNIASSTHSERDFILRFVLKIKRNTEIKGMLKEYLIFRMSYSGVCDEKIYDLLDKEIVELKLSNGQVFVLNNTRNITNSLSNILSVIQMSIDNKRKQESNPDNFSHTIFRIMIESWNAKDDIRSVQVSELNFVELSDFKENPSVRAVKENQTNIFPLALESLILEEYKLESFQQCINNHNGKLMELLQGPLSDNAFILMLFTITPCAKEESYHTLSLASQLKSMKTDSWKSVISTNSTIELLPPLSTELLTELKKIQNGNLADIGAIQSGKRYDNTRAIDKRVVLFKNENIPGHKGPIVHRSKRDNWLKTTGSSRQHLFKNETGLPTIIEISPEKSFKKRNIMQLVDVTNLTFNAAFTDFDLDLITANNKTNGCHDISNDHVTINEHDMGPNKQDSAVQTLNDSLSPTPKSIWRKYIADRSKAYSELLEYADLESRLLEKKENNNCYSVYPENVSTQHSLVCSSLKNNSITRLEEENMRLAEGLILKNEELNEIKNDFQSLKSDLERTICLLTNENAELLHNLSREKERLTETESNHRKTTDELHARIREITDAKIKLENEVMTLNNHLNLSSKTLAKSSDEQLIIQRQDELSVLKTENIKLSELLTEKNQELEDIKESKLLQYEHECIYKSKVVTFTERCEYLAKENEKLSAQVIVQNEELEVLKEQNKILSDKVSMLESINADENDIEQLRSENNILRNENMALKMKVTMLADESTKFSSNLLGTSDNIGSMYQMNLNNNKSDLTDDTTASIKHVLVTENCQELASKVAALQNENDHLSCLNEKLSELKSSPCSDCARFKKLNESRKPIALEIKAVNRTLDYLQKKFDRECAHIELLKNQEVNFSCDTTLNSSFADTFNLSFVAEKVQLLNNELQTVRELYEEKCDKFKQLCDTMSAEDVCKPSKKQSSEIETKIEETQRSINEAKEELAEMKNNVDKFKTEKVKLLKRINTLRDNNKELQEQVSIFFAEATEKMKFLESVSANMRNELEEFLTQDKERLKLDIELECLRVEKIIANDNIAELYQTLNKLNNVNTMLTNKFAVEKKTMEVKYKTDLRLLKEQCSGLKRMKAGIEECAILQTKDLQSSIVELQRIFELSSKWQEREIQLNESEDLECRSKLESFTNQPDENVKESETRLNKYEGNDLTQEVTKNDLEECIPDRDKIINDYNNMKDELDAVKTHMIEELRSFDHNINTEGFLTKTVSEVFKIFIEAFITKENEMVENMRKSLEDEIHQSNDNERRTSLWAKDLESENENLQTNLKEMESLYKEERSKVSELDRRLKESNNENDLLKTKVEKLKLEIDNLQNEFDKWYKDEVRQENDMVVAHKRETEMHEVYKQKENDLQVSIKAEKEILEKRIELINTIEMYKMKNMELKNNIEGLEANEKQLKNIIELNVSKLKMHNQTILKIKHDFDQLTETSNELTNELEEKKSKITDIIALLKNKCDALSEYKNKLETIMPEYEMLQSQAKDRRETIERYKEEIAKLTMEKDMQIKTTKDKLNSEYIKNIGLSNQLDELNKKHIASIEELNNLKDKYEKLQQTNMQLERKLRDSTPKTKATAVLEELRDLNKRLQNNLDGASNRVTELLESKNNVLRELVDLKGQYEMLRQENAEIKNTLSMRRYDSSCLSEENNKYDALIQEKNKIALELGGNKLLITQKINEIQECTRQIEELTAKQYKLSAIIQERDSEILLLKSKLNQVPNELKEKWNILKTDNKNFDKQDKAYDMKSQVDGEEIENKKFYEENIVCKLKKECSELQRKLSDYENKLESINCNGNCKMTSSRRSRNKIFNQRRDLESVTIDADIDSEGTCQILRKKIHELDLELASKDGQISALQLQIQSENFAYQQKCKDLEQEVRASRKKNDELRTEVRKLQRILIDVSAQDCVRCKRWKLCKREQACQTSDSEPLFSNTDNGIFRSTVDLRKLERDYEVVKGVCCTQRRQITDLENKLKALEDTHKSRK